MASGVLELVETSKTYIRDLQIEFPQKGKNHTRSAVMGWILCQSLVSGPDYMDFNFSSEVNGMWKLATNYHGAYLLSFLQTSSLLQAPIQTGLSPDCVKETLYFTNIYFS